MSPEEIRALLAKVPRRGWPLGVSGNPAYQGRPVSKLAQRRIDCGLSIDGLAVRLGCARQVVRRAEHGIQPDQMPVLPKKWDRWAELLGVTIEELAVLMVGEDRAPSALAWVLARSFERERVCIRGLVKGRKALRRWNRG